MDQDTRTRAAAEAASQTTGGFFQGLGWAAAAGAATLIALHPVIVTGVVASGAALAIKKWRSQGALNDPTDQAGSPLPTFLAKVRERVKSAL
jgi:hypothetical protein